MSTPKIGDLEALANAVRFPKVLMLSETWLTINCPLLNIDSYCLLLSPKMTGRYGGVAMYVHSTDTHVVKDRSCDHICSNNIHYLLIEFIKFFY